MRILVLGGAGYVGSHTARALARGGHSVTIYDNLSTGYAQFANGFELIVGDIRDRETLLAAMRDRDAVLHFAAHAYVGESVADPRKYFDNNVGGSLSVVNAALDAGVRQIVFSSTCATYGIPDEIPISDRTIQNPVNPYGASKLFFEHALRAYDRAYGVRYVALRYFNAAGADERGELGEIHKREARLVPAALEAILGEREALEIFGDDYPTPDGTCIRDYIHVSDLAEGHVKALDYLERGGASTALNLGTGRGYSVREVLNAVEQVTGRSVPVRMAPRRPGDPPELVADPSRTCELLDWRAQRDLHEIVRTAWKWCANKDHIVAAGPRPLAVAS